MEINQPNQKFQDESIAPMHTAEHLLNQTMIRMFGCGRAVSAHIEKKKSKCDYVLAEEPTAMQIDAIETMMNKVIAENLSVYSDFIELSEAEKRFDMSRLPKQAEGKALKIVYIGDYDVCPCIGIHVKNTSEIGIFKILSASYTENRWRVRWTVKSF